MPWDGEWLPDLRTSLRVGKCDVFDPARCLGRNRIFHVIGQIEIDVVRGALRERGVHQGRGCDDGRRTEDGALHVAIAGQHRGRTSGTQKEWRAPIRGRTVGSTVHGHAIFIRIDDDFAVHEYGRADICIPNDDFAVHVCQGGFASGGDGPVLCSCVFSDLDVRVGRNFEKELRFVKDQLGDFVRL